MIEFLIKLYSNDNFIQSTSSISSFKYLVENEEELNFLKSINPSNIKIDDDNIFVEDIETNKTYQFDLAWTTLRKYGFYLTCKDFISQNKKLKKEEFYIYELESSNDSDNIFVQNFLDIYSISEFIFSLSIESEDDRIIFLENKYLKLIIDYNSEDIRRDERLFIDDFIKSFLNEYNNSSKEIKTIYKNELLEFLEPINRKERFKYLFLNFKEFNEKCVLGYEFYLSNFSYNKLKIELNNAVSDFHKNIRSVINDSQSKLIAIPASALLVFTTVDTNDILKDKNVFIFLASFILSLLMNFFIKNQLRGLSIIKNNKDNYLQLFEKKSDASKLSSAIKSSTDEIDKELKHQRCILQIINIINWIIPIGLLAYICTYIYYLIQEISF